MVTYAPLMNDFSSPCQWRKVVWRYLSSQPWWTLSSQIPALPWKQLVEHIYNQDSTAPVDTKQLKTTRRRIAIAKEEQSSSLLQQLRENMSSEQLRANDLATMKGGLSWLTTLPWKSENFSLNKREFYDAFSLRYRWTPKYLPSICPCGKRFDVNHAMSCMKGGFVHRRHDVQDLFATLLKDVCHDVEVEPHLETLTGEVLSSSANSSDEARLDFSACGFWQKSRRHSLI